MEKETKSQAKRITVTGGGGFLGKAIVSRLVDQGHRVANFSRQKYTSLESMGVTQHQGDLADGDAVVKALAGCDAVFHVAARPGVWGDYESYYRPNVVGTQNVINGCRANKVPYLVYTSSPSVVFDGTDMNGVDESVPYPAHYHAPYPATKALAERSVLAAADESLATVALRPHLIWGPEDNHLVPRILARAKRLRRVGPGGNRVDTIYVDNAAQAHLLALEALEKKPEISGNVYFISDDEPIELWEMVNRILAAGGKPPVKGAISAPAAYRIGTVLEWIYRTFRIAAEPPMTRFVARELATAHWFDITAAKRDLGYAPEVSIDQGLQRLAAWLDETGFA